MSRGILRSCMEFRIAVINHSVCFYGQVPQVKAISYKSKIEMESYFLIRNYRTIFLFCY